MKFELGEVVVIISTDFNQLNQRAVVSRYQKGPRKVEGEYFYYPNELRKLSKLEKALR